MTHIWWYALFEHWFEFGNNFRDIKLSRNIYNSDYFAYNYFRTLVRSMPNTRTQGVHPMEINAAEIKQEITELLEQITDIETLDFVHKLLLSECR